ncbi:hypothetical protein AB4037_01495 [Labrys sp. KB_33_2]|uniref:hypothetical protein n=1 Tax=Labrys sp. KB_33_2 TaxID=3237479 RepID=UPI003F92B066
MAYLASLVEFLNSGKLGPLYPGVGIQQVIDLLGPPKWWVAKDEWNFRPVPDYWGYGRLELQLDFGSEPSCEWFQLEDINHLRGEVDVITGNFAITLDGLNGDSNISDVIKSIRDLSSISIHLADVTGNLNPTLFIGPHIHFGFGIQEDTHVPGEDLKTLCGRLDRECIPLDIYSMNGTVSQEHGKKVLREKGLQDLILSGSDFLRLVQ